jgi:hypothetical protein
MELKSLTQRIKCVEAESGCLSMLRECLVFCSMRLGVPFIAPRQPGAVGHRFGRQFLPSVEWCTGQSGVPPDNHCSSTMLDFLPYQARPTVGPRDRLAHRTLSGVGLGIKTEPEARYPKNPNPYPFSPMSVTRTIPTGNKTEYPN